MILWIKLSDRHVVTSPAQEDSEASEARYGHYHDNNDESRIQEQGSRTGVGSLAATMAQALGEEATVVAHTTFGHTTENPAARVFGAEAGGGAGGIPLFDIMYPDEYITLQLDELFHPSDDQRAALYASLRQEMWYQYYNSIYTEHHNPTEGRYPVPMGQEVFVNPDRARELLHADWVRWIQGPGRIDAVRGRAQNSSG